MCTELERSLGVFDGAAERAVGRVILGEPGAGVQRGIPRHVGVGAERHRPCAPL